MQVILSCPLAWCLVRDQGRPLRVPAARASRPGAAGDITAGLDAAGWRLVELHIDRAYLSSELVRDRDPELAIFCKT